MGAGLYVSNRLCLDFVNTVHWRGSAAPEDRLTDYAAWVGWSRGAGILGPSEATELRKRARADPEAARTALEAALALRETLSRIVVRWIEERSADPEDLEELNSALAAAPERRALRLERKSFTWDLEPDERPLGWILWPIVWSAADVLVQDDPARVKSCGDERCAWVFYDTSRNGSRRWCSMQDCGNRAKARRHYRRTRTSA